MKPDEGVPSICDFDCKEYLKIFWVIKGYVFNVQPSWKSISGLWNIDDKCGSNSTRNCFEEGGQALIKITKLTFQKFNRRGKRSFDSTPDEIARHKFADRVASAIARGLKWNTIFMDWFAYPSNATNASDPTSLEMVMVLADKKALGIVTSFSPTQFTLSQSLQQLSWAIERATLPLQVDGYNVWLKSLASCSDKSCNDTQILANSDKPPVWSVPTTSQVSDGGPVPSTSQVSDGGPVPTTSQVSDGGPVPSTSQVSDGGPVSGEILITRTPAKRNGNVAIYAWNVRIYGITAFVIVLMNKLSF